MIVRQERTKENDQEQGLIKKQVLSPKLDLLDKACALNLKKFVTHENTQVNLTFKLLSNKKC